MTDPKYTNEPPSAPPAPGYAEDSRVPIWLVAALIIGALLHTVLFGGGGAWAYLTASAQATDQTTSRSVAITQANFGNLNQTYRNTHSTLTQTGSFTVTNTGQAHGSVSVSVSGSVGFLTNLPIQAWPVASTGACTADTTVPSNAVSGTWESTKVASGTNLKAGASIVYCVRTALDHERRNGIATQGGSQSAQSVLSATLSAPGQPTHTDTAVTTHRTEAIHPLATSYLPANKSRWYTIRNGRNDGICLDASGGKHDNAPLISWECNKGANQRWQFRPINGDNSSLVTLQPRHAPPNMRAAVKNGEQLLEVNDHEADTAWYVQKVPGNRYLLVSHFDGTCLSVRSSASGATHATVECTDPDAVLDFRREGLSYESDGWTQEFRPLNGEEEISPTGTILFGANIGRKFMMQYQPHGSSKWTDIATTDPESDRIKIGGKEIRDRIKIRFISRELNEEVVYEGLTARITTAKHQVPGGLGCRNRLGILVED